MQEKLYFKILSIVSKEIRKVLNEGEALENNKDIYNIDYVFDDLDQIPEEERKRQYMMPLSGIAAGFPYGHNISFIDEKNPVIVESATKTYDPKYYHLLINLINII